MSCRSRRCQPVSPAQGCHWSRGNGPRLCRPVGLQEMMGGLWSRPTGEAPPSLRSREIIADFRKFVVCIGVAAESGVSRQPPGKGGIARGEIPQVLTVARSRSADRCRKQLIGGPKRGDCRGPGQAAAVDTRRAGRRCLPRGASSPMRQGVTDTRRSLRILADYPSETAQVTGTERLTWPSPARRSRRLRFCQVPIGVRPADTIPAVP
jgi:hypothetical protein